MVRLKELQSKQTQLLNCITKFRVDHIDTLYLFNVKYGDNTYTQQVIDKKTLIKFKQSKNE